MRIEIYLIVHPGGNPIEVVANPSYETRLKRKNLFSLTTRMPV
jgi:hypothetical protein